MSFPTETTYASGSGFAPNMPQYFQAWRGRMLLYVVL